MIAICLTGECPGWDVETKLLSHMQAHRDTFPIIPEQSRFNRRRRDLMAEHENRIVIGDKAYVSAPAAEEIRQYNRIRLLTKRRKNQKRQLPARFSRFDDAVRQMIETVTSQLTAQFSIETHRAHILRGLCTRLYAKLTAHTLCIHINRLLGVMESRSYL